MSATYTNTRWSSVDLWGPPIRKRWGGLDIPVAIVWLIVVNVAASIPALFMMFNDPEHAMDVIYGPIVLTSGMIALWSVFVGYPLWATHHKGRRSLRVDFGWSFRPRDLLVGLGLGVGLRALDMGLGWVASKVIDMSDGDNSSWLFMPRHWAWTVFFVLGASVIAPALEELFFRGFLLRSINRIRAIKRTWRTTVAVLGSSALFGLMHATAASAGGLYVVLVTGSLGGLLALLTVKSRRLGPAVMTHIVFNSTGVLLAFLMG